MSEEVIFEITPPSSPTWVAENISANDGEPGLSSTISYDNSLRKRWFVCNGEAKLEKVHLHVDSYLKNDEIYLFNKVENNSSKNVESKTISLFSNDFDFASVFLYNSETLFKAARSEILYLHNAAKLKHTGLYTLSDFHSTQDHLKARQSCVRMFMFLREYLSWLYVPRYNWIVNNILPKLEEQLNGFRLFLRRLSDLPEYVLHHSAQTQGGKCMEASYHLYHNQLDMLWLHLTSVYLVDRCRRAAVDKMSASQESQSSIVSSSPVTLDQNIIAAIADLVQVSILRFEKIDVRSLVIKSPFNCSCVAELWTLLMVMANRLHNNGICDKFWTFFNKVMEQFLSSGNQNEKLNCKNLVQSVTRPCSNPYGFTLWLLKHVAMAHSYEEELRSTLPESCIKQCSNYSLLEAIVKGLLSSDLSEAHLRVYLIFIEKIIIKYWVPETKTIVLLWEYFQKRLNSTFYVPGTSIDSIAVMSQSVAGMVKQVKSLLSSLNSCVNSFQMFLRILGLYLQRVSGQSQHWNQIRGRIYSKLSSSKVQGLNETGLYHLVTLFLTLAITADSLEVSTKLQSLLANLAEEELDENFRRLVWRSHLSVCLLQAERGQDLTPALAPLTSSLGQQHMDVSLYRTFFEGLKDILDASPSLKIDYTMLVGMWIPRYLTDCSPNDSSRLLETLDFLIQRVQSQPMDHEKFQTSLWQVLGPYLRQRVSEDNAPLQLADICLHLCFPQWETGREVVQLFLNNNATNISLVRRFLWRLVQNHELLANLKPAQPNSPESHEVLIIKNWIRCSLLSLDYKSSELSRVTNYITCLPFIAGICMDLPSANDPLKHFVVAVSNKFKNTQDICERSSMRQLLTRVLMGLEKWVEPYLKQTKSQELLSRIYHVVGLVFKLLPTFIYMKSRPNTVLKGLIDLMFLPQAAYKPDYDPQLKLVMAADIHLYVNGLADLSKMQDGYIERCIQDIIKIYLPLVANNPQCKLHECIQRADGSVRLMLNTVCLAFIKRKTSSPHPHCSQALKFLNSVVKLYSRNNTVMLMLMDVCFQHVCDVIMFCDDFHHAKNNARDFMINIFESYCFKDELSTQIIHKFDNLCREYLPFFPKKLFGLFGEVLKHRPELVSRYIPSLHDHVKNVELKRGINHDHSLRIYMEDLENALNNIRKGP